jgi:hypothetical protein
MTIKSLIVIAAMAVAAATSATSALAREDALSVARAGTAGFHDVHSALAANYAQFSDADRIACIDLNPRGMFDDWNPLVSCTPSEASASVAHVRSAAAGIQWTVAQLKQLADAYSAKNPGWRPPSGSGLPGAHVSAAQATWTSQNLDALANAYAALNPGWTRPAL